MRTIFLFVDKPTFIGDLLKTEYLNYLSSKYRVIVFTRKADQNSAASLGYVTPPNVTYIKWQPENDRFLGWMKFIRFSCSREFDHLTTTKHFRNRRGQDGNNTLLRVLSRPLAPILNSKLFFWLERLAVKRSPKFEEYLRLYKPSLMLVSTPGLNNFEAEAILLAKKYKLTSVAVNCAWDNLTTRVTRVRPVDYFLAWHEPMRQEAIEIHHFNPSHVFVSGPIRYDYYVTEEKNGVIREKFLESKNLDPQYKTILYTTQKNHFFEEAFIRVLIGLRDEGQIPYTNILVRVHPLASPNRYKEFSGIKDVCLDRPDQTLADDDLLNLKHSLLYSDLNINYSSTISLEAMLFDKPIINYREPSLKSFELNHYLPLVQNKTIRLINNDKLELKAAINDYLKNPGLDSENRQKLAKLYFPFRDGLSYKRNVDFLDQIIKNETA